MQKWQNSKGISPRTARTPIGRLLQTVSTDPNPSPRRAFGRCSISPSAPRSDRASGARSALWVRSDSSRSVSCRKLSAPVQYGPQIKAAVVHLTHHHMIPVARTDDLFGLLMSDATVLAIHEKATRPHDRRHRRGAKNRAGRPRRRDRDAGGGAAPRAARTGHIHADLDREPSESRQPSMPSSVLF